MNGKMELANNRIRHFKEKDRDKKEFNKLAKILLNKSKFQV